MMEIVKIIMCLMIGGTVGAFIMAIIAGGNKKSYPPFEKRRN
ncbi:hypothetical protein [Metabacillus arenae]|nr:hypothetical protein [Metabacillus arenae]